MTEGQRLPLPGVVRMQGDVITEIAEDGHWWFRSRTLALLDLLDRHVGANRSRAVLDVGSGAGNMFHHLRRYGKVVGAEPNPRPIAIARQRGYDVRQASGDALPWDNGAFGLVALLDTIEHCPDDAAVLRECSRVLQPGGWLVVTAPALMWLWTHNDVLNAHYRRYTAGEMRRKLQAAGLRVQFISYTNFLVFPLSAPLLLWRRLTQKKTDLASPHFSDDADAYQVEMEPAPPLLNRILTGVGRAEAALLRRVALPIGTSVMALAQKTG